MLFVTDTTMAACKSHNNLIFVFMNVHGRPAKGSHIQLCEGIIIATVSFHLVCKGSVGVCGAKAEIHHIGEFGLRK